MIFEQKQSYCWVLKGWTEMAKAEYRSAVRSRKLITAALADLLQEKPLDKITVTEVVNRAEINRGTFYAHYTDIPDVINSLIQQTFSRIREILDSQPLKMENLANSMMEQIEVILKEDIDFYRKVMASNAAPLMQEQLVRIVVDYLLQHEAQFSGESHEQFVLKIKFCAGGLSNLYRDWFDGMLDLSLEELTQNAQRMLYRVITG